MKTRITWIEQSYNATGWTKDNVSIVVDRLCSELTHFTSRMLNMTMRPCKYFEKLFLTSPVFWRRSQTRGSWLSRSYGCKYIIKLQSTWKLQDIMKKPFTFMTSIWDLNSKLTRREAATSGIQKTLIRRCNRLKVIHQTYGKVLTSKAFIFRCSIFITHRTDKENAARDKKWNTCWQVLVNTASTKQ